MSASGKPEPIRCCDGCKREVADMDEALAKAWHFLEISKRWRCPQCARELVEANRPGVGGASA